MVLLEVKGLKTYFRIQAGEVKAVDNVSLNFESGKSYGLAGESGCGKTTTALSIMRLIKYPGRIVGGEILFKGQDLVKMPLDEIRKIRWDGMSLIFQGALNALNPVYRIGDQIVEAIRKHQDMSKDEAMEKAKKLLAMVGIDPKRAVEYPHEFSGGMKQRVMTAMALCCEPDFMICDEPVTALDVVACEQLNRLLEDLRKKLNTAMLFISHDLSFIARTCDFVSIMYAGKIAESADSATIFRRPMHPYAIGLINSFPSIRAARTSFQGIEGSPPNLINPPKGCRFAPRCSKRMEVCDREEPQLLEVEPGHVVSCHLFAGR